MKTKMNYMLTSRIVITGCLLLAVLSMAAGKKGSSRVTNADRRKAEYVFLEAENQKQQGNSAAFYDLTRYAHSLDPENTAVSFYLGYGMLMMHDAKKSQVTEALSLMRQHVDAHPNDTYELMVYSDANMAVGKVQEGLRVMKILAQKNPNNPEIKLRLADGYIRTGDYAKGIAVYDTLQMQEGRSVMLSARKVMAYQSMNDTLGALNEMRSLLATAPRSAEYNIAMANMMHLFAQPDSALHYLNLAQEYEPDNGSTYLAKAQYYNEVGDSANYDKQIYQALMSNDLEVESKLHVLVGYIRNQLMANDSTNRVQNLFQVMLDQHPHEPDIRSLYSEYLVARKDYKGAAEQLEYALDLDATDANSWHRLMVINIMGENYPKAIEAAERALALNPDSVELYRYIAPAYYQMKEYDRAIATYDRALTVIDTTDVELHSDLLGGKGDVYAAMGDTVQAVGCYEQALKLYPGNTGILNNYAYYLAQRGENLDRAERMSAITVKSSPGNATFLDTYAWVFFKKKDYKMALFYIESALNNLDSPSAEVLEHYGDILFFDEQTDKAVEQWQKALELDESNEQLMRKFNDRTYYEE